MLFDAPANSVHSVLAAFSSYGQIVFFYGRPRAISRRKLRKLYMQVYIVGIGISNTLKIGQTPTDNVHIYDYDILGIVKKLKKSNQFCMEFSFTYW